MADKPQSAQTVPEHDNHGNSVAAWVAVSILLVGFLLLVLGWVRQNDLVLYGTGVGVIVAGLVVGKVLQLMGYGIHRD